MAEATVGDIRNLELEMGEDISAATTLQIKIEKPDGTVVTKTATAKTGFDTVATATTASTDISAAGTYKVVGRAVFSDGDDVESPVPARFTARARMA